MYFCSGSTAGRVMVLDIKYSVVWDFVSFDFCFWTGCKSVFTTDAAATHGISLVPEYT